MCAIQGSDIRERVACLRNARHGTKKQKFVSTKHFEKVMEMRKRGRDRRKRVRENGEREQDKND